jgi:rubrerythrin
MSNICDKIDELIADEQEAIDSYNEFLPTIPGDDIHKIYLTIENIREDEQRHYKELLQLKDILSC